MDCSNSAPMRGRRRSQWLSCGCCIRGHDQTRTRERRQLAAELAALGSTSMSEPNDGLGFIGMFRSGHSDTSERASDGFELRRRHMIPAHGDYLVVFEDDSKWAVEAWDDDGTPMIVATNGLTRVDRPPLGFSALTWVLRRPGHHRNRTGRTWGQPRERSPEDTP